MAHHPDVVANSVSLRKEELLSLFKLPIYPHLQLSARHPSSQIIHVTCFTNVLHHSTLLSVRPHHRPILFFLILFHLKNFISSSVLLLLLLVNLNYFKKYNKILKKMRK